MATYKPTVKRGGNPHLYHIESATRPGTYHATDASHMTCTCEAGRQRPAKRCWHLALAIQYDGWRQAQRAKAQQAIQLRDLKDAFDALDTTRPAGMAALQEAFA